MRRSAALLSLILAVSLFAAPAAMSQDGATKAPSDTRKQTTLGKYATALEAYLMWRAKPKEVVILDVRTPEEYVFVGHADMSYNIPVLLNTSKFDPEKKSYSMLPNEKFVEQVSKRFGKDVTIMAMCRSGQRAATAVNMLAKAGFTNVYNVVDSFEGDAVSDPESVYNGKRMKNGWKNYGLPWTYELKPDLVWIQ